jgi:PAS domain-containing protein
MTQGEVLLTVVLDQKALVESFEEDASGEAGIFTWDIERNLLFADRAVALLFGLDYDCTLRGLPLEAYMARVHRGDRSGLAKVISETIMADIPQRDTYRVQGADGRYRMVAAFGKAFCDANDLAVLYSGIVIPLAEVEGQGLSKH